MNVTVSVSMPPGLIEEIDEEREKGENRSEAIRRMLKTTDHLGYQLEQAQSQD